MVDPASLLVLWDVDGTLIHNGGVSKQAYALGFEKLTGMPPTEPVITDGMTDPAILRSLFERHGLRLSSGDVERVPEVMKDALGSLLSRLREQGHAMPGAREAIDALSQLPGVVQSVLTGNIAPNAFAKVAAFDLHPKLDFEVGGFGSDNEVRSNLVGAAQAKASAKYGEMFTAANTVLVGDTPRDIEAGRLGGAFVIAVATGAFDEGQLSRAGADVVLPDLCATRQFVERVLGFRSHQAF